MTKLFLKKKSVESNTQLFSCESSSRYANVCQSVRLSETNAYLFVRFTSIFYNSKSYKMKLRQSLISTRHNYKIIKAF